jgi:cellulose synthase/poly-beta-1,6-N-acetylglucosamine synthase-like glycosyltransferase
MSTDGPAPEHRFADVPPVPERPDDRAIAYGRLIVAVVFATVLTLTAFAFAVGRYFAGMQVSEPPEEVQVGPFTVLVSQELPPAQLVLLSALGIVIVAIVAVSFEVIAALMSVSPRREVLESFRASPEGIPRELRNTPMDTEQVRVTVLIPAHNEATSLPITLGALAQQTRQPDRVIVVADNCTDATADIARQHGYEAFETVDNTHRKGGALNQALAMLLPTTDANDVVMVMDADTALGPRFLEVGADRLAADPELTAVGGVFYGEDGHGLVGQFQRNEYTRYSLQIRARHGRVFVLTGTASMFRAEALLDVAAARGVYIPGQAGRVYDTAALTEDNELTLALKSLGATMTSPPECTVTTEIMPTWRNLWVQRKRWQRGALENLSAYGITRPTIRYWGQQVGIGYGAVALNLFLILMVITVLSVDQWIWFPFWLIVGSVFVVERVLTTWRGGWKARGLAVLILPELLYDVFLQVVFVKCLIDITFARRARWGHVQHDPTAVAP